MLVYAELEDGTRWEEKGSSRTWMCLADRVAFERYYKMHPAVMQKMAAMFDEHGKLLADADASALNEEWVTFFIWRELRRRADIPDFDQFIEQVIDAGVDDSDEQPDPTGGAEAPSENSPS